ncbi:mitochondrial basic amino acids transporter-like [Anneissia japonica]|uniref:mitochondrial basic amino acids transporter-like n=1 Tax=Anneissia japonica TaxID=1529436 RepID=UPI0014255AD2|nr:mitochondrial basic amino acids transporter-like [Anneissia japonica]
MAFTWSEFVAGGASGIAGTVVGHPFDTVKVRLQNQGTVTRYKSGFECFMRIAREESTFGFFKGMISPLCGAVLSNSFLFGIEDNILELIGGASTTNHFIAGSISGLVCTSFICPLDLAKIRLQMQGIGTKQVAQSQKHYKNSLQAIYKIFKSDGLQGCYRGIGINLIRDIPSTGLYFCADHYLSSLIASYTPGNKASTVWLFFAGGLAGSLSWLSIYPLDVIKSRWQADGVGHMRLYSSYLDCLLQCTRKEGWSILFKGVTVTMLRGIPVNGAIFVVYKYVKQLLTQSGYSTV